MKYFIQTVFIKGSKRVHFYYFFYISNEIFYSNSLPYKRYIFDKCFVKFLLKNFENSVIGTSSPVTLQKKVLSA